MSSFVIEYQLASGDFRLEQFDGPGGRAEALRRRLELEATHLRGDGWEVVSLHADSLDTIRRTHSRYFMGKELSPAS